MSRRQQESGHPHEAGILFSAAVSEWQPDAVGRLREALAQADWDVLFRLAVRQGMTALLVRALRRHAWDLIPSERAEALLSAVRVGAAQSVRQVHELKRLNGLIEAQGLRAVFIKGPVLSVLAYENPWLRASCDLDLFAHPDDVEASTRLLESAGYVQPIALHGAARRAHRRAREESIFSRRDRMVQVDLLTNIVPQYFCFPTDALRLWDRLATVPVDGTPVRSFLVEPLLLLLCVHGTKHCWGQMSDIVDFAAVLRRAVRIDWQCLRELAIASRAQRMLRLGLSLACGVVPLDFPAAVRCWIDADAAATGLAADILRRMCEGRLEPPEGHFRTIIFHVRARERWRDRLCYLARLAFMPSYADWKAVPLPRSLFWLYYVLRPLRLLGAVLWKPVVCRARPRREAGR